MSGEDLLEAAFNDNMDEVVRYVNEEGVDVDCQNEVSFSSFYNIIIIFFLNVNYEYSFFFFFACFYLHSSFYDDCLTLYVSYVYDGLMIYE